MRPRTWRKHHKWFGLTACFFLLMLSLSGIVLNHRSLFSGVDISRSALPPWYRYDNWNGGLMRGTIAYGGEVLIYGANGIWRTDSIGSKVTDFNSGILQGADNRNVRNMVRTNRGDLFALTLFRLYIYNKGIWDEVPIDSHAGERLSDMTLLGDTLVVMSRSLIYTSSHPYTTFQKHQLPIPEHHEPKVTLFKTIWQLHSGELFGSAGKLIVDTIALVIIFLAMTGFLYWLLPKTTKTMRDIKRFTFEWHDKTGRWTIAITLLICITGWSLRPPLMVPLVLTKTKPLPGTTLSSQNPWNDKLRMIAYDEEFGDWVISTSEGFYSAKTLDSKPAKLMGTPPVSVMGINVLRKDNRGNWLVGSFSGMYVWDRSESTTLDYFTYEEPLGGRAVAVSTEAISGYSTDFATGGTVVEYGRGTTAISQPDSLSTLPMSLWNVALEVHTGRIYIGSSATMLFIFIIGIIAIWSLWSGWKVRKKTR